MFAEADGDDMLHGLIIGCNAAFLGHGLSYYLIGSWAQGDSNAQSDIDISNRGMMRLSQRLT